MKLQKAMKTYLSHDINGGPFNGNVPFGGYKASGNGGENDVLGRRSVARCQSPSSQGDLIRPWCQKLFTNSSNRSLSIAWMAPLPLFVLI